MAKHARENEPSPAAVRKAVHLADTPLGKAALKVVSNNGVHERIGGKPKRKPDPKHDQQETLAASVGEKALDDLTKH